MYKAFKTSTNSIAKMTQKRKNENEIGNENDEVIYPKFMVCFFDC